MPTVIYPITGGASVNLVSAPVAGFIRVIGLHLTLVPSEATLLRLLSGDSTEKWQAYKGVDDTLSIGVNAAKEPIFDCSPAEPLNIEITGDGMGELVIHYVLTG
jgi:hypothetical protein